MLRSMLKGLQAPPYLQFQLDDVLVQSSYAVAHEKKSPIRDDCILALASLPFVEHTLTIKSPFVDTPNLIFEYALYT